MVTGEGVFARCEWCPPRDWHMAAKLLHLHNLAHRQLVTFAQIRDILGREMVVSEWGSALAVRRIRQVKNNWRRFS